MADPDDLFKRSKDTLDGRGWSGLLQAGFGTIFLAWVYSVVDLFGQLLDTLFAPVRALMAGFATFITGTIGSGLVVIDAGTATSVRSFTSGLGAYTGIMGFAVAIGVVVVGLMIIEWWWNRANYSPWGMFTSWRD